MIERLLERVADPLTAAAADRRPPTLSALHFHLDLDRQSPTRDDGGTSQSRRRQRLRQKDPRDGVVGLPFVAQPIPECCEYLGLAVALELGRQQLARVHDRHSRFLSADEARRNGAGGRELRKPRIRAAHTTLSFEATRNQWTTWPSRSRLAVALASQWAYTSPCPLWWSRAYCSAVWSVTSLSVL